MTETVVPIPTSPIPVAVVEIPAALKEISLGTETMFASALAPIPLPPVIFIFGIST